MTPARPIRRVWLVANPSSGSTGDDTMTEVAALLGRHDAAIAGRTAFPAEPLPDAPRLVASGADTLVICGGDGTINAASDAAGDWPGQCLVLPGGTMNALAKALHGDADHAAIVAAVPAARLVHPPVASADGHRALVAIILGPAASWVHARERVRAGRFARAVRAAAVAWSRSFGRTVQVHGSAGRHRAVIVIPDDDGLEIATISAGGLGDVARLGWNWLRGDWRSDAGVSVSRDLAVTLSGRRKVRALFDGEPVRLASPACVRHGRSPLPFVATS